MSPFRIIIFIVALSTATITLCAADEIIKHYDEHHNITGYTVIDGNTQTHFDSSWNRKGYKK